eukprot:g11100.t1
MRCFSLALSALIAGVAAGQTCNNGLPGVSFGIYCCTLGCGTCGGMNCSDRAEGLTGDDCCLSDIDKKGTLCSESKAAPCIGDLGEEAETCFNGLAGVSKDMICCSPGCGTCGGPGCSARGDGLDGDDCCLSNIARNDVKCSESMAAPCIGDVVEEPEGTVEPTAAPTADETAEETMEEQTCYNGLAGVSKGKVCCSPGCGTCGGEGCSERGEGLDGDDCCISDILRNEVMCSESMAAPCIGDVGEEPEATVEPTAAPTADETAEETMEEMTCDNGLPGVSKDEVCCSPGCGTCGGVGCSDRAEGLDGDDCCLADIRRNAVKCSESLAAPCVGDVGEEPEATVEPTAAPTADETAEETMEEMTCDNGLPGVSKDEVCCSPGCGTCGGVGCSDRAEGLDGDDCCLADIRRNAVKCSESLAAPCVGDIGEEPEATVEPTTGLTEGELEGFEEIGCYTDRPGPERIKMNMISSDSMTPETCQAHCVGSLYFGVQFGVECWCDDGEGMEDYPFDVYGESDACTMACSGNGDEICGGKFAMSVYVNIGL